MDKDRALQWLTEVANTHPARIDWTTFEGDSKCPVGVAYTLSGGSKYSNVMAVHAVASWLSVPHESIEWIAYPFSKAGMIRSPTVIDILMLQKLPDIVRHQTAVEIVGQFIKYSGRQLDWWEVYDKLELGQYANPPHIRGMEISPG